MLAAGLSERTAASPNHSLRRGAPEPETRKVNRPSPRALAGQMLAYVDDCLPQEDRQAVESG